MKQPRIAKNEAGCVCSDWVDNVPLLNTLLLLGKTHDQEYQGTSFRFCPWCGQPLAGATGQRDEALLQKHRRRIEEDFFAKDQWGMPQTPNMLVAVRSVTDYRQRTGDSLGTLDLMLTFLETGTRFTNEFGDIDEPFYEGLEFMLDDFRELLLAHPDLYEEADLAQRLANLARDAGWLGWGYGDYVSDQVAEIQQHFGDV